MWVPINISDISSAGGSSILGGVPLYLHMAALFMRHRFPTLQIPDTKSAFRIARINISENYKFRYDVLKAAIVSHDNIFWE